MSPEPWRHNWESVGDKAGQVEGRQGRAPRWHLLADAGIAIWKWEWGWRSRPPHLLLVLPRGRFPKRPRPSLESSQLLL